MCGPSSSRPGAAQRGTDAAARPHRPSRARALLVGHRRRRRERPVVGYAWQSPARSSPVWRRPPPPRPTPWPTGCCPTPPASPASPARPAPRRRSPAAGPSRPGAARSPGRRADVPARPGRPGAGGGRPSEPADGATSSSSSAGSTVPRRDRRRAGHDLDVMVGLGVDAGRMWVWVDGGPVALTRLDRPVGGIMRVGPVTRHRAARSRLRHLAGRRPQPARPRRRRRACMLFTQLGEPHLERHLPPDRLPLRRRGPRLPLRHRSGRVSLSAPGRNRTSVSSLGERCAIHCATRAGDGENEARTPVLPLRRPSVAATPSGTWPVFRRSLRLEPVAQQDPSTTRPSSP